MYSNFDFSLDDELINEFDEQTIANFLKNLYRQAERFLLNIKAPKTIYVNSTIYAHCCRNLIADIAKFRHLQILTSDDNVKWNAYTAAWWIRRKPFQHKEICSQEFLYVNETFAATLIFQASKIYAKNANKIAEIAAPLMNYLKFQNVTPQSLELFLKGLKLNGKTDV